MGRIDGRRVIPGCERSRRTARYIFIRSIAPLPDYGPLFVTRAFSRSRIVLFLPVSLFLARARASLSLPVSVSLVPFSLLHSLFALWLPNFAEFSLHPSSPALPHPHCQHRNALLHSRSSLFLLHPVRSSFLLATRVSLRRFPSFRRSLRRPSVISCCCPFIFPRRPFTFLSAPPRAVSPSILMYFWMQRS